MRLFIAEKPSLARAIAEALPTPHRRAPLHIACGDADVVAWCAGHVLQPAEPEAYGDAYKAWCLETLPIVPRDWKLAVSAPDLLKAIVHLLPKAARVVHAGDPDREGQLLVDEVLSFLGYRGPVDRLLVRDLSPEAVRRQLGELSPNDRYQSLSAAALARQRADWLYGMNMTRLYTVLGRAAGYEGVLSVGRVQTPLLGLIVVRDRAIAEFQPVPYYAVTATMRAGGGEVFPVVWAPSARAELDAEGRLLSRKVAEDLERQVLGQQGRVAECATEKKAEPPPLPHSLANLQMEAGRRLRMSAQEVLETCQSLYESHRLLTYPRSDCCYLPEGHHARAKDLLASVIRQVPALGAAGAQADLSLRSRAWNDKKVTAHHAIIPTPNPAPAPAALSDRERAVYELVARRYLAQFCPPHAFLATKVALDVAGERFTATGRQVTAMGWRALAEDGDQEAPEADRKKPEPAHARLPQLKPGDAVAAVGISIADKRTQPPKPFDDASLIAAMCGVAKFVRSPAVKRILTEADGIGTPATRAAILETLLERGYVRRVGRAIVSTETGRALVRSLPEVATTPDMTATWEAAMRAIEGGTQTLDAFLARVRAQLDQLVAEGRALGRIAIPAAAPAPEPARRSTRRRRGGADALPRPMPTRGKQRTP
jgi:DNA topoisomerase-3